MSYTGYAPWRNPSFEEGFDAKMDLVVEAVQTAVRNMELEKYEVASGYQIVQKVRLNNRSFDLTLSQPPVEWFMLDQCICTSLMKLFPEFSPHLVAKDLCESVLHDHCDKLVPQIRAKIAQAPLKSSPDLLVKIEAKKAVVANKRRRDAVRRLADFMTDYKDHVFTEEDAVEACGLATVRRVQSS